MSYEVQGRQEHGYFGHGTGPKNDPGQASRISAIINGAIAALPVSQRRRAEGQLNSGTRVRLADAMASWAAGSSLGPADFAGRFFGRPADGAGIVQLHAVASAVGKTQDPISLGDSSANLADAIQAVGLDSWPRFIFDAATLVDGSENPRDNSKALYQIADNNDHTNTTTDAVPASSGLAARYVGKNPHQWAGQKSVGSGECVPLVRAATSAPRSIDWSPGALVQGNTTLQPGTAIATFDAGRHYVGHAAIYLGQDASWIRVIDQWNNRDAAGQIYSQHTPSERVIYFGRPDANSVNQGENYRVIK